MNNKQSYIVYHPHTGLIFYDSKADIARILEQKAEAEEGGSNKKVRVWSLSGLEEITKAQVILPQENSCCAD